MTLRVTRSRTERLNQRSARADRVTQVGILGSGLACLLLLALEYLGLVALLFPPAPNAPQQRAMAGHTP
jgi:hypothetical protein